ncbi:MAG: hypothetical protein WBD40_19005 [Tepidisphaeraceae bacterium]
MPPDGAVAEVEFGPIEELRAAAREARRDLLEAETGGDTEIALASGKLDDLSELCERYASLPQRLPQQASSVTSMLASFRDATTRWLRRTPGARLDKIVDELDSGISVALALTVTGHLASELRHQAIGGFIDVDEVLSDEPRSKRTELLKEVASRPRSIDGVVDVPRRRIYRVATSGWSAYWRCATPLWAPIVGAGLVVLVFWLDKVTHFNLGPKFDAGKLLGLYIIVLAGALFHIGVVPTRVRFDAPIRIREIRTTMLWLQLRWVGVALLAIPVAGATGVVWATGMTLDTTQDVLTALLSGYSADSVWANVLQRGRTKAQEAERAANEERDA